MQPSNSSVNAYRDQPHAAILVTESAPAGDILKPGRIRPIAICIIRNGDRILVMEAYDPTKQQTFYRPLGGGIEFGERGIQAVAREMREETGAEVTNLRYLGTIENIFTFDGRAGHEIVLVYEAELVDSDLYEKAELECREDDGSPFTAVWKALGEFTTATPLYPEALVELLGG